MASLNSGYRTIHSEIFAPVDDDMADPVAESSHGKFIAIVVLLVVTAASFATAFAVIS
jgi:hypothetical protein